MTDVNAIFNLNNVGYSTATSSISVADNMSSKVDNVSSKLDKIIEEHRKPDVRKDQRSKLEISDNKVYVNYYENGFFRDRKFLIPEIKSVEVFYLTTVKVTFKNGHIQTATVSDDDNFSLENGILYCLVKEMIGKEGTSIINKLVSYATKIHYNGLIEQAKTLEAEIKAKQLKDKKDKKFQKYIEKKRAKQKEQRISELTEAIVRATKQINSDKILKKGAKKCILHS